MSTIDVRIPEEKLPFNQHLQRAAFGHLLRDAKFFRQCQSRIKPEWFSEDPMVGKLWGIQLRLAEKLQRHPGAEEVKQSTEMWAETPEQCRKLVNLLGICQSAAEQVGLDYIRGELTTWLESATYAKVIHRVADLYNRGEFDRCAGLFRDTAREAAHLKFDQVPMYDFSDWQKQFAEAADARVASVGTGLQALDQAMLEGAENGGMLPGDMTLVAAPSDVGKTTFMVTVAIHNILRGKKVLFMTHEGRPEGIRDKFWSALMQKSRLELYGMHATEEGFRAIQAGARLMQANLSYMPYNKPGMTVEDVEPLIRRAQEDLIAKSPDGKGYDLLISDYPAKLWTARAKNTNIPRREIDRIVYDYYVQLALEYKFHSMCAIQINREGSRINNGVADKKNAAPERLLTKEDVSESWGPVEMAQNVITINRSFKAKQNNRLTLYIDKSKNSETGTAIVCRSRYDLSITHHQQLGGCYYRGTSTLDNKLDAILASHEKGTMVPLSQHLLED